MEPGRNLKYRLSHRESKSYWWATYSSFFKKIFIYLFMIDIEREREAEPQEEGEAGSMPGA